MILTVTLNPAIDRTVTTDRLMTGQVNRCEEGSSYPGGKGINVARILKQLGQEVTATGFLGGYTGRFIEESLIQKDIHCEFQQIADMTRTNVNVIGKDGFITEILEAGPVVLKDELQCFFSLFKQNMKHAEVIVLSGSAARGVPKDIYSTLITEAKKSDKKVILDSSLEYLKEGVKAIPYMIKPNLKELEYLTGEKLNSIEEVAVAAKQICDSGINKVVVSLGKQGIIHVDETGIFHAIPPTMQVINTVGCGDSIVATYAAFNAIRNSRDLLLYATAVSAANTTSRENGVIPMDIVELLKKEINLKQLSVRSNS